MAVERVGGRSSGCTADGVMRDEDDDVKGGLLSKFAGTLKMSDWHPAQQTRVRPKNKKDVRARAGALARPGARGRACVGARRRARMQARAQMLGRGAHTRASRPGQIKAQ